MDVSWCFRYQTAELRLHEKVCGYVYTELTDIEWERNGFLNYDHTPKEFGYDPRDINAADVLLLDGPPARTVEPGAEVAITAVASLFSHERRAGRKVSWRLDFTDCLGATQVAVSEGEFEVYAKTWRVTRVGEIRARMPERPGLAQLRALLEDVEGKVLGRTFAWFEVEGWSVDHSGPVLRFRPENASARGLGEPMGAPDGAELVAGAGRGAMALSAPLPPGLDLERTRGLTFVAELASYRNTNEQTDERTFPSDVELSIGGVKVADITLPDCPADSRGVLSYLHGVPGKHGYRLEVQVPSDHLRRVLRKLASGTCEITVKTVGEDRDVNGLALFFRRAGRFPVDPVLLLHQ